jgi:chorismate mutase
MRIAVKPTSSISKKQKSVTYDGKEVEFEIKGRHDPCICPRIVPVAEAMTALVLIDHILMQEQLKSSNDQLDYLRKNIDLVDQQILLLLQARNELVKKVAQIKKENSMEVFDASREEFLWNSWLKSAELLGLNKELVYNILNSIIDDSRKTQTEIIKC